MKVVIEQVENGFFIWAHPSRRADVKAIRYAVADNPYTETMDILLETLRGIFEGEKQEKSE